MFLLAFGCLFWLGWQEVDLPGSTSDWLVKTLLFVLCVATSGLRDVCFMFFSMGACSHFSLGYWLPSSLYIHFVFATFVALSPLILIYSYI